MRHLTSHLRRFGAYLVGAALVALGTGLAAQTLDEIKSRGVLVVGVKKDVPLWGLLDNQTGEIKGFEPDLAKLIADKLGVKLRLVGVLTSERADAVIQRKVDLLIATLSDTPERRQSMTLVLPHYYASGVNLIARKTENFKSWAEIRNRRICGRRGAFYNRMITVQYGADIVALYANDLAAAALRDGRCSGWLYDDIAIIAMLKDAYWSQDFEMPMTSILHVPWSMALAPQERGSTFEAFLSNMLIDWHRTGTLKKMEAQWGIPATQYLEDMNKLWLRKEGASWYCGNSITGTTPKECQ